MLKEHKDSIRVLSQEYARLLKENERLKNVIKGDLISNPKFAAKLFFLIRGWQCADLIIGLARNR